MQRITKIGLTTIFLIATHCPVLAQTGNYSDTIKIKPVNVQTKISKKDIFFAEVDTTFIKQNKNLQLSDFIQQTTAVNVKSFGNYGIASASFRGTAATHTKIFWNNIPLNSPMLGQTDLSIIPTFFADKITLIEGAASASYTTGAIGGAIVMKSNLNSKKNLNINISNKINSFKNYYAVAKILIKKNKISADFRFITNIQQNNFNYLNTAIPELKYQKLKNADFNQIAIMQQIQYKFNNTTKIKTYCQINLTNRNIPPIMSFEGLHRTENQKDKLIIAGTEISKYYENIKIKYSLAFSNKKLKYFLADSIITAKNNSQIIKNNSKSNENLFHNNLKLNLKINEKLNCEINIATNYYIVNTYDRATYAKTGYLKNSIENILNTTLIYNFYNDFIISVVAAEQTENKKIFNPIFVVNLGKYSNSKPITFGLNIGTNLHRPTLNDLYWQPGGNPNLTPEKGKFFDTFIKYKLKKNKTTLFLETKPFISLINDWIIWKPSEFHYWTAENIKQVLAKGINYTAKLKIKNKIQIILNYAFTLTTSLKTYSPGDMSVGKQLIYIPKNKANLFFYIYLKNSTITLSSNFTGKRFTSSDNDKISALEPYLLFATSIQQKINLKKCKFKIKAGINNIFNVQYQTVLYRPMPGRNFYLTISFIL